MMLSNFHDDLNEGEAKLYSENGFLQAVIVYKEGGVWNVLESFDRLGHSMDKGTLSNGAGELLLYDLPKEIPLINTYDDGMLIK